MMPMNLPCEVKTEVTVALGCHTYVQNTKLHTISLIPAISAAVDGSEIEQSWYDRYAVATAESLHQDSEPYYH